jgi:hypothetical protein
LYCKKVICTAKSNVSTSTNFSTSTHAEDKTQISHQEYGSGSKDYGSKDYGSLAGRR